MNLFDITNVVASVCIVQVSNLVCEYRTDPIGIDIIEPRLSWQLLSSEKNVKQEAYQIWVAQSITDLNKKSHLIWDSGKIASDQSVNVSYDGPELQSMQRYYWKVRVCTNEGKDSGWSEPSYWEMGILKQEGWKASWVGIKSEKKDKGSKPCQYFRKEFELTKKIQSARVYVTSKGLYQLFINEKKVSKDLFTPGWTSYNKRLQYQTYDVTDMLRDKNAIGAILGDGWYRGYLKQDIPNSYGDKLAFLMQLRIDYSDGTNEIIATGKDWKVTTGPILESDIYNGETYDARLEMKGWNGFGFADKHWEDVTTPSYDKSILVAQQNNPVKPIQEIEPINRLYDPDGKLIIDMGQNMVGWVRIKVQAERGDTVTLKFGEVLDNKGFLYTENLRKAKATDKYIFKGNEEEVFEPHFTYHGFRYIQIEKSSKPINIGDITGIVIHTDMPPTGSFNCSDSLINKLQHNILWTQKGNFFDIPTDCPQRDERCGWLGDAQLFCKTAGFNYSVVSFYTKWLRDIAADQFPDGKIPLLSPNLPSMTDRGGSAGWSDAIITVPWNLYLLYGDTRVLKEFYPNMVKYINYIKEKRAGSNLIVRANYSGKYWDVGDWLAYRGTSPAYPGATTDIDLVSTAYFYLSTNLLSKIAHVLDIQTDADYYSTLASSIKKSFISAFVTEDGWLVSNTQTAYSLALSFGLLNDDIIPKASYHLGDIIERRGHITTGILGTQVLLPTLSSINRDDLAFSLLMRKAYPSWLYMITRGATTVWERWDSEWMDGTFQELGREFNMNSFNHYGFGTVGEWLYSHVGGLKVDPRKPGYKHIVYSPHLGGGLEYAKVEFNSMYGLIRSDWEIKNGRFYYKVTIPANTTATVLLPSAKLDQVTVDSVPLAGSNEDANQESGFVKVKLGSGAYHFQYPYFAE